LEPITVKSEIHWLDMPNLNWEGSIEREPYLILSDPDEIRRA
jgi:hypothetical protein